MIASEGWGIVVNVNCALQASSGLDYSRGTKKYSKQQNTQLLILIIIIIIIIVIIIAPGSQWSWLQPRHQARSPGSEQAGQNP